MYLERLYEGSLAQASYLIGCPTTRQAFVVDPNRDVARYTDAAAAQGYTIVFVTETHVHADFVSGARDLARATGAQLLLSGHGGADWSYRFAASDGARLLHHGDRFQVGEVFVDVMHTPGHTPEHICFVLTDREASDRPLGILSGDFVFAGDVGRPDLLERVADVRGTMTAMAGTLFRSLQDLKSLPDYLQIWPGHGAGSACGKALGAMPSTTIGYERIANWAFQIADAESFVGAVLADQPEPPRYFATMKRVNRDGPPPWRPAALGDPMDAASLAARIGSGTPVVDIRPTRDFAEAHVTGTINIPFSTSFLTWAGSLLPYDRDVVLLGASRDHVERAVAGLGLIGLDCIGGWGNDTVLAEWRDAGRSVGTTPQIEPLEVAGRGDLQIIDVRRESEWNAGHIPGARHLFLGELPARLGELSHDRPIVTHCESGSRSAIAASLLRAGGFKNVYNMAGGIDAWRKAGLTVE
jgi:hydroxyacylglutathione hydrolase